MTGNYNIVQPLFVVLLCLSILLYIRCGRTSLYRSAIFSTPTLRNFTKVESQLQGNRFNRVSADDLLIN